MIVVALAVRIAIPAAKKEFGSDSYYHLLVARDIRKTGHVPKTDAFLAPELEHTYPPLLHQILFLFRGRTEQFAMLYLSVIFDIFTIVLLFATADWLGMHMSYWPALIYALSPLNVLDASSLNPRPLANLLLSGVFVATLLLFSGIHSPIDKPVTLLLVVLLEAGVMMTNKLALQALLPIHLLFTATAIWFGNLSYGLGYFLAFPAAIAVATLATKGNYARIILPDHIRYLRVHLRHGDYRTGKIAIPSPLNLLKSNPLAYAAPFIGLYMYFSGYSIGGGEYTVVWSVAILALAQAWVWGDGFRYLQFGTFPGVLIIWSAVLRIRQDSDLSVLALLGILIILTAMTIVQLRRAAKGDLASRLIRSLKTIPSDWMSRLNGAVVYSPVQHYVIPYASDATLLTGNPSSKGVKINFKINDLRREPLIRVAQLSANELEVSIDYFLVFKKLPSQDVGGLRSEFENEEVAIIVAPRAST